MYFIYQTFDLIKLALLILASILVGVYIGAASEFKYIKHIVCKQSCQTPKCYQQCTAYTTLEFHDAVKYVGVKQ